MGSRNSMKVLKLMVNAGHLLGFYPYYFPRNSDILWFNAGPEAKVKLLGNICNLLLYQIYLVFRCSQAVSNETLPFRTKVNSVFLTSLYILFNFNIWITVKHYGSHHHLFNEVMKMSREMKENLRGLGVSGAREARESRKPVIQILAATAILPTIMRASGAVFKPKSLELYTSLTPDPMQLPLPARAIFAMIQLMLSGFMSYGLVIHGMFITVYIASTKPRISQLMFRSSTSREVSNSNALLMSFQLGGVLMTIVRLFFAIISFNPKDLISGALMLVTILLIFKAFAEIYDASLETLESWDGVEGKNLWMAKFKKGCRPIRVSIGDFYYADIGLVLTIVAVVISNTLNLVLGYRQGGQ